MICMETRVTILTLYFIGLEIAQQSSKTMQVVNKFKQQLCYCIMLIRSYPGFKLQNIIQFNEL